MTRFLGSLRSRLVLLIVLAMLPVAGFMVFAANHQRAMQLEEAGEYVLARTHLLAENQAQQIESARQLLAAVSRLDVVEAQDGRACSHVFGDLIRGNKLYRNLLGVGPDGTTFCSAASPDGLSNVGSTTWFRQAVESRAFTFGGHLIEPLTGRRVLLLAYPTFDGDHLLRMVVALLDLETLQGDPLASGLPAGWSLTVLDHDSSVLLQRPAAPEWIGRALQLDPPLEAALQSGGDQTFEARGPDGVPRLFGVARLTAGEGPEQLYGLVGMPLTAAYADADRSLQQYLALLALATGLALAATWFAGDALVLRPVRALLAAVQRLREGDLAARAPVRGGAAELRGMAEAFNEMAATLELRAQEGRRTEASLREAVTSLDQARAGLERRVAERTGELVRANAALEAEILQHRQTEETLHRRGEELGVLYAVAAAASVLDPETLLQRVLELVLPVLGSPMGWVVLPGRTPTAPSRIAASYGVPKGFLAFEAGQAFSACPMCSMMLESGDEPSQAEPVAACPLLPAELVEPLLPQSHASVPLRAGDRLLGVLNVGWQGDPAYGPDDRALLSVIGREVGVALENAQLFEAAQSQATRLGMLNEIGQAVTSTLDLDTVLSTLLERVREVLDARSAAVGLLDAATGVLEFRQAVGEGSAIIVGVRLGVQEGIAGPVVATRRSAVIPDVAAHDFPAGSSPPVSAFGMFQSVLAVPMSSRGNVIGVIEVFDRCTGTFDDEDTRLLESVAAQAAIAIENARLYEEARDQLDQLRRSQMQLLQAEKLALMGRLAASLAHEINNPLQAIRSHLELSLDFPLPPEERERYLRIARQEIERLSEVAHRVLGFYRPATAMRTVVLLADLVDRTMGLVTRQAQRAHIQVELKLTRAAYVLASGDQLVQVFLNLVINAIEAIGDNGHLTITEELEGDLVVLTFANNGPPIAAEHMQRLFEPFFTTKPDGTGLGLSVSRGLVEQHGGSLNAANLAGGCGVSFTVRLPRADAEDLVNDEQGGM